jgi:mitochondrial FAD-linked sulfhydryl oxidase
MYHEGSDEDNTTGEEPVDRESLGRATWTFLHTLAASQPAKPGHDAASRLARFMRDFAQVYPCGPCAESFRGIVARHPPDAAAAAGGAVFARWMCYVHNEVNKELGKEEFDCTRVQERWGVCESCASHEDELRGFAQLAGVADVKGMPRVPVRSAPGRGA